MRTILRPDAQRIRDALLNNGIRAVIVHRPGRPGLGPAFLITARHTASGLDRAIAALAATL